MTRKNPICLILLTLILILLQSDMLHAMAAASGRECRSRCHDASTFCLNNCFETRPPYSPNPTCVQACHDFDVICTASCQAPHPVSVPADYPKKAVY
ncbi:hypothetical protein RND81_04G091500 [Saponaria officinalis]|uniref:Uncharacterized protein n=1 Tax=Saponaria officinalis TaxID=3572 RepID=A0AAW1LJB3_SAPOF